MEIVGGIITRYAHEGEKRDPPGRRPDETRYHSGPGYVDDLEGLSVTRLIEGKLKRRPEDGLRREDQDLEYK